MAPNLQNPMLKDPTRTGSIRLAFIKALRKKFARLRSALIRLVVTEDAFGLSSRKPLAFNASASPTNRLCLNALAKPTNRLCLNAYSELTSARMLVGQALDAIHNMPTAPPHLMEGKEGREVKHLLHTVEKKEYDSAKAAVEARRESGGTVTDHVLMTPQALSNLHTAQRTLVADTLESILRKGPVHDDLHAPKAIHFNGKTYLRDGNHRVACAILTGKPLRVQVEAPITQMIHVRLVSNRRWEALTDREQVNAFKDWLRNQFDAELTGKSDEDLWRAYVMQGYRQGKGRSYTDVKTKAGTALADAVPSTQQQFLTQSLQRPASVQAVQRLAGRAFDDLEGVTNDMSLRMSRVLTDGLVRGATPSEMASDLDDELDIGRSRAETIARTEVVRAHAEGQLDAMEEMGVDEVGVAVEWTVADNPCEECEPLEGIVMSIDEARGMLPRHPNCRCAWIPNLGDSDEGTKDTKATITKAIRQSVKAGKDDFGPGQPVSKDRPEYTGNAFCPTGEGGGVDPSCSPAGTTHPIKAAKGTETPYDRMPLTDIIRKRGELERSIAQETAAINPVNPHADLRSSTAHANRKELQRQLNEVNLAFARASNQPDLVHYYSKLVKAQRKAGKTANAWTAPLDPFLQVVIANMFCPTGAGGGVDPTCGREGGSGSASVAAPQSTDKAATQSTDKAKFVGEKVGKAEHVKSQQVEHEVVSAFAGQWEEDNKFYDGKTKDDKHFVEIKSLLKGSKQAISVHPDALLRKVEGMAQNRGASFHTVAVDERATYGGGEYQANYSGNRLYYKRGSGRYSLSQMHPVKDHEELVRLMNTPDNRLPEKAKGSLPKGAAVKKLREDAEKAHSSRLLKDRARKARIKAMGKG